MKWLKTNIEMVKIDGEWYALNGCNGQKWVHCWHCFDRFTDDPEGAECEIAPVYDWSRWNETADEFQDTEGNAIDGIIDYEVL